MASRTRWIVRAMFLISAIALGIWLRIDPYGPGRVLFDIAAPLARAPTAVSADQPKPLTDATGQTSRIELDEVASGFEQPTDLQFVPGSSSSAIVLEKNGDARWLELPSGRHGKAFHVDVLTNSEEGLLGLAFHPDFAHNGRFFLNYVRLGSRNRHWSRIAEWRASEPKALDGSELREIATLLEVEQPFPNHDAGQLAFGPDGYLYIGFGDGGAGGDPYGNGQNLKTLLGSMLRIDVDHASAGKRYAIPKDNPFLGRDGVPPETWAYGLRNPWRYSFDPQGRLIVADVGQDSWEEVSIVAAGDNLGWSIKEGFMCSDHAPRCGDASFVDPVHVYGRDLGVSITGGLVYEGASAPALRGKYVFGDFGSGNLFALTLPADRKTRVESERLGQFAINPVAFARDANGELYVLDFGHGAIKRIQQQKL